MRTSKSCKTSIWDPEHHRAQERHEYTVSMQIEQEEVEERKNSTDLLIFHTDLLQAGKIHEKIPTNRGKWKIFRGIVYP